jgi:dolichol-phosphate mannosyltransferase
MKLSVVIAAYDEAANIEALTCRLAASLVTIPECSWELVFVVEGQDGTYEALQRLAREIEPVRILYRKHPVGLGAAFRRGFAAVAADADYVITMDADLNHQPEEIPRLLAAAQRLDSDVLVGSRFVGGSEVEGIPLSKRALSGTINKLMSRLFGLRVRDKTSGFRIYRAEVVRRVHYENDAFAFLPEMLILASGFGYRIAEEPIHFCYRRRGQSKMAFWQTSASYLLLLRRTPNRWTWGALALLTFGVALRVATAFPSHKYPGDADSALNGVTALRLLHGHLPVFFATVRIGAIGSYLSALLFFLFGASRTTLAAGPVIIDSLMLGAWYLFLREVIGSRLALLALPFAVIPTPAFTFWTYMPNGYPETLLFCATTLWLSARLASGDERKLTVFAFGLSLGLGWWTSLQTLACAVPALVWLLWRRSRLLLREAVAPLVGLGFLLGALPWIVFNIHYQWPSFSQNFATRPPSSLAALLDNGRYLLSENLPELLASTDPQNGRVRNPSNAVQLLLHLPTLAILAGASLFILLATPFLRRRSVAAHDAGGGGHPQDRDSELNTQAAVERAAWPLFVLVVLVNLLLNLASGAGGLRGPTVRYVLPIYLVVPALLALSLARLAARSRALAALLATIVVVFNLAGTFWPWTEARRLWAARGADDERTLRFLEQQHVTAVLGSYWLVYPLNFLSREAILGIPLDDATDFRREAERLPHSPVRWALMAYSPRDLAPWAGKARTAKLYSPHAPSSWTLVLPADRSSPEEFRQRLLIAWRDRSPPTAAEPPVGTAAVAVHP